MKYGKTPWKFKTDNKYETWIEDADEHMLVSDINPLAIDGTNTCQRIVATVNACAGIPSEFLEAVISRGLRQYCTDCFVFGTDQEFKVPNWLAELMEKESGYGAENKT